MPFFAYLQQENKGFLLQENGGKLILGIRTDGGGGAGNKTRTTQKGVSAVKKQVLDRPVIIAKATSLGTILLTNLYNKTHSKLVFPINLKITSKIRTEIQYHSSEGKIKVIPKQHSEATLKIRTSKSRAVCEMVLHNHLRDRILDVQKEMKKMKLLEIYKFLKEDLRKTPSIQVDLNVSEVQRGDLMRITTNMNERTGQIWMRIIDTKGMIVQKAGLVKKNASGFQILIGTRDLKSGSYIVQVSNHNDFSPLGVAEFQVKGTSPIMPFVAIIPFLLTPDSPTEKFEKVIFRTMMDSRVDEQCKQFENKVFSADDPNIAIPPLHFNCRCYLEGINE
jgi:hypothetical protein